MIVEIVVGMISSFVLFVLYVVLGVFIKIYLQRNDIVFELKYKEIVEGDTFGQRLLNVNKKLKKDYNSLGSCDKLGKITFYLPSIYGNAHNQNEDDIILLIRLVDEHENMHKALFRTGIPGKYHHKILEKMEVW